MKKAGSPPEWSHRVRAGPTGHHGPLDDDAVRADVSGRRRDREGIRKE
jgi:hypothetical protein